MAIAVGAQTLPSSPRPFYPPTPSGPLPYKGRVNIFIS